MAKFFSHPTNPPVVIIGLGRFGMALGEELVQSGVEVLGIDVDEAVVAKASQNAEFDSAAVKLVAPTKSGWPRSVSL